MSRQKIQGSQLSWLMAALTEWQTAGLIQSDQADRILARYESENDLAQNKRSLLTLTLQAMAALLFGLSVLLVIGFNWEAMPRETKLAIILVAVACTHGVGLFLKVTGRAPRLAESVVLLGCFMYGAGIWLIAQAFHLDAHYPDGVWWWAVGVLPFALCLDTLLCHILFVVLMAIWAGQEIIVFKHLLISLLFGPWQWPNGAYSLLLMVIPGLIWGYRKGSPTTVGLYVALLTWWAILQPVAWGVESHGVFWIGSIGAILLIISEAHDRGDAMAIPYRLCGVLLSAGSLIPLSSYEFWRFRTDSFAFDSDISEQLLSVSAIIATSTILILIGVTGLLLFLLTKRGTPNAERSNDLLYRLAFPVGLALCLALMSYWSVVSTDAKANLIPTVLANLAMLGLSIHLIRIGVREERLRPFGAGILYFLIWANVRYFDLFSGAGGMLLAAGFFFLCGIGLVVLTLFWRRTQAMRWERESLALATVPFIGPAWIDWPARWVSSHVRLIMIGTIMAQLLILGGMIVVQAVPLVYGETIVLQVNPIDPRDPFRGDYVILDYEINRNAAAEMLHGPGANQRRLTRNLIDRTIYVTLEPDPDGKHLRAGKVGLERPVNGKYICGRFTNDNRQPIQFGIEAFYVQEGKGLKLEKLRNSRKLSAEIALSPWGQAKLRRLIVEDGEGR